MDDSDWSTSRIIDLSFLGHNRSWFKLNFDDSKLMNDQASFWFTIRNNLGELCLVGTMGLSYDCSILKVEGWGFRKV